jgi:hypothetical protein
LFTHEFSWLPPILPFLCFSFSLQQAAASIHKEQNLIAGKKEKKEEENARRALVHIEKETDTLHLLE